MNSFFILYIFLFALLVIGLIIFVFLYLSQKQKLIKNNSEMGQLKEKLIKEETLKNSLLEQIKKSEEKESEFKASIENQFKLIAQNILDKKSQQIKSLQIEELEKVINPFKSDVEKLEKRVNEVHDAENKQRASLEKTIENLIYISKDMKMEANKLSTAIISDNKKQGNWGEMVLEKLLDSAGLKSGIHYEIQKHISSTEFNQAIRPDVIVNLPDNKKVIIDSKVSIKHYYESLSCDENEKSRLLKEHCNSINRHIKELANKNYPKFISGSLNYVLLFIPSESALSIAMETDFDLYDKAVRQNILLITPSTLLVSLNIIHTLWQSESQRQNIEKIIAQGNKIYEKARLFVEDIEAIGKSLNTLDNKYQSAKSRLYTGQGNLVDLSEKMRKMGLKVNKSIDTKVLEKAELSRENEPTNHLF